MKIENEGQYQEAFKHIGRLLDNNTFTVKDSIEIEALTNVIAEYENKHHPIPEPTFSLDDMIGFANYVTKDMDMFRISHSDLDAWLGSK